MEGFYNPGNEMDLKKYLEILEKDGKKNQLLSIEFWNFDGIISNDSPLSNTME